MATRCLAALAATAAMLVLSVAEAHASCAPVSASDRWKLAAVIVDARALEGPTATGVQRFRVIRYLKGRGPAIVRVETGVARNADGGGVASSEVSSCAAESVGESLPAAPRAGSSGRASATGPGGTEAPGSAGRDAR